MDGTRVTCEAYCPTGELVFTWVVSILTLRCKRVQTFGCGGFLSRIDDFQACDDIYHTCGGVPVAGDG